MTVLSQTSHFHNLVLMLVAVVVGLSHSACSQTERERPTEQPLAVLETAPEVSITDTTDWDCGGNGGSFGILAVDGESVDTVDLYVGVQHVVDGLIFLPMRSEEEPGFGEYTCPTEPVLFDGVERHLLAELLPMFNGAFSNPVADDSVVYYWGFGDGRLHAMRYNFVRASADTTYLTDDANLLATGNRYQFLVPHLDGERVVFPTWPGRTFVLNMELELIADSIAQR